MAKSATVICRYKNCLHESNEVNREEAVKSGTMYYHADCLKTKEEIKQIIDLFKTHINPNPVYAQLHSTIKNIVFTKNLGSEFLLFGLQYYINHKIPLHYPQGLHYVVQNKDVIDAYNKAKLKNVKKTTDIIESNDTVFTHVPTKNRGFADILK